MDQATMMLETEKKYRLSKARQDEIATSLEELGATFSGVDLEENTIYGGVALEANGGVVRIRKTQDRALLTYKRRIENEADVKRQIEYETEIGDADIAAKIIGELDLKPRIVYEKRRRTWSFLDVEITLDELPFGFFMEIEGPIASIGDAEARLKLDDLETEHATYPQLTMQLGKRVGARIEARFG
jgi:adenylate cyclase class 2